MVKRKELIIPSDENLSIADQCNLLGVPRASFYYEPRPESEMNLKHMRMIDEQYLITPFFGSRQITEILKSKGEIINRKKVQRLMRLMQLAAQCPQQKTSIGNKEHYKYPYLLNNLDITFPNQVWGTDITYIPTEQGYLYCVVILDWFSRYVISWSLSDSLESNFCVDALERALLRGVKPQIMNSDQGCQYTSKAYTGILKKNNIQISMSGKGRCWDNIFVERFWRSFKYEEVYLKNYSNGKEAQEGMDWYFNFYNDVRLHSTLGYKAPRSIYMGNEK
jgi:putative transposase